MKDEGLRRREQMALRQRDKWFMAALFKTAFLYLTWNNLPWTSLVLDLIDIIVNKNVYVSLTKLVICIFFAWNNCLLLVTCAAALRGLCKPRTPETNNRGILQTSIWPSSPVLKRCTWAGWASCLCCRQDKDTELVLMYEKSSVKLNSDFFQTSSSTLKDGWSDGRSLLQDQKYFPNHIYFRYSQQSGVMKYEYKGE